MLTATFNKTISNSPVTVQNENAVSDIEVSRRVLAIRSRWTVAERIRRRREAEKRFGDLIAVLSQNEAA